MLNKKIVVILVSVIIISLAFLVTAETQGRSLEISAFENSTFNSQSLTGIVYNVSFFDSYGHGGWLQIFSGYASHSSPINYASVFQVIKISRSISDGKAWDMEYNMTFDMSSSNLVQNEVHLTPGYYRIQFGTLVDYNNFSEFKNGTLPPTPYSYANLILPSPSILIELLAFEIFSLAVYVLVWYYFYRKNARRDYYTYRIK